MQLWIGVWERGWSRGSVLGLRLGVQEIEGTVRGTAGGSLLALVLPFIPLAQFSVTFPFSLGAWVPYSASPGVNI